jgi:pimeloyl-ACP methyl ester carboxylesterase
LVSQSTTSRPQSLLGAILTSAATIAVSAAVLLPSSALAEETDTFGGLTVHHIYPTEIDPDVGPQFNHVNYVAHKTGTAPSDQVVLFLPGTGGDPEGYWRVLRTVAADGYRVIGLEYNDVPAVAQVCPQNPDPACSGSFREERIFGDATNAPVDEPQDETIVNRLIKLIDYLDRQHPDEGWGRYLDGGKPDWSKFVVSGHSQGAGHAAYVAKKHSVARVVLFSSPWDDYGPDHKVAPWIPEKAATPPELWFAEYHEREDTRDLIEAAYAALPILKDNLFVFNLGLAPDQNPDGENPYHVSTVLNTGYVPQWRAMFGSPQ